MKRLIFTCVILLTAPSIAYAQSLYTDLVVGAAFPNDVETIQYDFIFDEDHIVGDISREFDPSVAAGFEVGFRGVGSKHISIGLSYDYLQTNLSSITAAGTINDEPASGTVLAEELEDAGFDVNPKIHTVLGNIYFDFVGPSESIQPYLGVGAGGTFIEETNGRFTLAGTAGIRVPLARGFYTGVRYRYLRIFDYEDDIGIEYKEMDGHIVSFMFGAQI